MIGVHEMQEITLKRKIYTELQKWKKEYAPEYALFIKGARRVGKTTIAEELGKNEYKSYITINFQSANDTIRDLFVKLINLSKNTVIISKRRKLQNTSSRHKSRLKQMGRCLL